MVLVATTIALMNNTGALSMYQTAVHNHAVPTLITTPQLLILATTSEQI